MCAETVPDDGDKAIYRIYDTILSALDQLPSLKVLSFEFGSECVEEDS